MAAVLLALVLSVSPSGAGACNSTLELNMTR